MLEDRELAKRFECLDAYTAPVKKAEREIVGRENEIRTLYAALMRPELCNVILLAEAGAGKTALVQGTMLRDTKRKYFEVDLARMIADIEDANRMAARIKRLFDETAEFVKETKTEVVLFIDEFHQIVQLSAAAVEALKPALADSGTRGIRVIAATTYTEFRKYISSNQPLVERLQRINLSEPNKDITVQILRGMAERYGVSDQFYNDDLFELIYEYTNRYVPANAQPRKSILLLDTMVGWHRSEGRRIDRKLLADVIYITEGVNVSFRVDATTIKKRLDERVFAQELATSIIEERLQICVADLNDKTKPMSSFLFTGSTGVGKGLTNDTMVPVWSENGAIREKQNGDLVVGDYVFNREGKPVKIVGVFPRGMQSIYKVSLIDGRSLYTDGSHLWTYKKAKDGQTYTNSTKDLFERGVRTTTSRQSLKYFVPMNGAIEYPYYEYSVDPYVVGAFVGNGCMTLKQLTLSARNESFVKRVAAFLGNCSYRKNKCNFTWMFPLIDSEGIVRNCQTETVFADYECMLNKRNSEKVIPREFMFGSIPQRWALIQGLFDANGSVSCNNSNYKLFYCTTSYDLACDIQHILYSLGVSSAVTISRQISRENADDYVQYKVVVKCDVSDFCQFFVTPSNFDVISMLDELPSGNNKSESYNWVGIDSIELMPYEKETTCIYVDDDEHLYQAGEFVVSHNTELTKQLCEILLDDARALIRFDMTEYANNDSLDRFRQELTARVWERPYSIILFDEVEKACAPVTRILLQVLDDGRLIDVNNRVVSFINTYIILTTNAGSEIYKNIAQYNVDDTGGGSQMKKYNKLIRASISGTTGDNRFPPELLGRIDAIIPFQPLSEETMKKICIAKLKKLNEEVAKKHNVTVHFENRVVRYLVEENLDTDSDAGGARAVVSKLESEVTTAVARFINTSPNVSSIVVKVEGDMAIENKNQLESKAYISVEPYVGKKRS